MAPLPDVFNGMRLTRHWSYRAQDGETIGHVGRYEREGKKVVVPFFRKEGVKWCPGGPPSPKPLFGLEQLLDSADVVFVVEGEKCAAAVRGLGLACVTSVGGSKAASSADWAPLSGVRRVVVLPDNDEPGGEYARDVVAALRGLSRPPLDVRVLRLPGLADAGDVVDWMTQSWPEWNGYDSLPETHRVAARRALLGLADTAAAYPSGVEVGNLTEWAEPVPLDYSPLSRWPIEVFPQPLRDFCEATARATETPIELACSMTLAVVATAAHRGFRVGVKEGYSEPVCLWLCAALEPGNRKSAVLEAATAPLFAWEAEAREAQRAAIAAAESETKLLDERIAHLRRAAAKAKAQAQREELEADLKAAEASVPCVPKLPQIWAADVTPENLGTIMAANDGAMGILSDEGGIFDTLAGRYSAGVPNLDLWLQAHSGSTARVNRGGRESVFLARALLSVGLTPQPAVIQGLGAQPGFRGRGLLARFLYVMPTSPLGRRTFDTKPVPAQVRAAYADAIRFLLDATTGDGREPASPVILRFDPDAEAQWLGFALGVETQLLDGGALGAYKDWGAKLPGAVARLAGLFHLIRGAGEKSLGTTIHADDVAAATRVGEALAEHAKKVFLLMDADPAVDAAQAVLKWIRTERVAGFTQREVHYALKHRFKRAADVESALAVLLETVHIREPPRRVVPHRPSRHFDVNPRALTSTP